MNKPAPAPQQPQPTTNAAPTFWQGLLAGLLIAGIVAGALVWVLLKPQPAAVQVVAPPTTAPVSTATPAPIQVHVSGAVTNPGVYQIPAGARVNQAVAAAGGLTAAAATDQINLAAYVADGQRLHIAAVGEIAAPPSRSKTIEFSPGPVNVNTATQAQLETLPGIGPALAQEIIARRPFATVEDLDAVPGIGEAKLEQLRQLVIVQQ